MGVCNCSMFCCTLLYVHSSIAIILMGKRELIALLNLSSWCPVTVERLFLAVLRGCLQFVIVVFPDHTHLLFFVCTSLVATLERGLHFLVLLLSFAEDKFFLLSHLCSIIFLTFIHFLSNEILSSWFPISLRSSLWHILQYFGGLPCLSLLSNAVLSLFIRYPICP